MTDVYNGTHGVAYGDAGRFGLGRNHDIHGERDTFNHFLWPKWRSSPDHIAINRRGYPIGISHHDNTIGIGMAPKPNVNSPGRNPGRMAQEKEIGKQHLPGLQRKQLNKVIRRSRCDLGMGRMFSLPIFPWVIQPLRGQPFIRPQIAKFIRHNTPPF